MTEWSGVVETQYGTIVLAEPDSPPPESLDFDRYWEEKCIAIPGGVQISLPDQNGDIPTEIRLLDEPAQIEPEWEHVTEIGLHAPSGRLQVYSWMPDEDLAGEIEVPSEPLIARIHWAGLEKWLVDVEANDRESSVHDVRLRVDLVPGELGEVRTLRTWHEWAPPEHESIGADGLRRFRGTAVAARQATLEPSDRKFWSPYPTTEEGSVHSLWRDPADGSRWALGSGPGGQFLQELTSDEAAALEGESFPGGYTYARDSDGRIWSADQIPIERAPALTYIPPENWAFLQQLFESGGLDLLGGMRLVDLPTGWNRITLRRRDGDGHPELVDDLTEDASVGVYQRWPDDSEIPG